VARCRSENMIKMAKPSLLQHRFLGRDCIRHSNHITFCLFCHGSYMVDQSIVASSKRLFAKCQELVRHCSPPRGTGKIIETLRDIQYRALLKLRCWTRNYVDVLSGLRRQEVTTRTLPQLLVQGLLITRQWREYYSNVDVLFGRECPAIVAGDIY